MNGLKLFFGGIGFISILSLHFGIIDITIGLFNYQDYMVFSMYGITFFGIPLFFWMFYDLVVNGNLRYKFLWILSFFVLLLGAAFYFWFVYRKRLLQNESSSDN